MIYEVTIENFYSIADRQVIDLRAGGNAPQEAAHLAPVWKGATARAPKVIGVFGANAAGKSNVLRALGFLRWFVRDSFGANWQGHLPYRPFLNDAAVSRPTRIALAMGGVERPSAEDWTDVPQCEFRYELELGRTPQDVISETLTFRPSPSGKRKTLVRRDAKGGVKALKEFGLGRRAALLETLLRPNASIFSTLAQMQHPLSQRIVLAADSIATNIVIDRGEIDDQTAENAYLQDEGLLERANDIIRRVDLGVSAAEVIRFDSGRALGFHHDGLDRLMLFHQQSRGTREFLKYLPVFDRTLRSGGVAVLDEIDGALHPLMAIEIIRWFRDPERNPFNAQFWFSSHNVALLDELEKEEVVLVEKDAGGRTSAYGLPDVVGVRRGENLRGKYLSGAYGAIPRIG